MEVYEVGRTQAGLTAWLSFIRSFTQSQLRIPVSTEEGHSTHGIAARLLLARWAVIVCCLAITGLADLSSLGAFKLSTMDPPLICKAIHTGLARVQEREQKTLIQFLAAGTWGSSWDWVDGLDAGKFGSD